MPRKTPTKNVDTLGRYDADPVRDNIEYFASKAYETFFMKPPCADTPGDAVETFYIDRKIEHMIMRNQQDMLRQEQRLQRKIFAKRKQIVQRDHDQLHNDFITLNNFVRDSEEKKKAALKKINDEIAKQAELKKNIEDKKHMTDELKLFYNELKYTTEQYRTYEVVLNRAVKKSETFESVNEMINRCDAIMRAQGDITILDEELFAEIEKMRKRIIDIIKQAELILLGLKNELTEMERSYNLANAECLRWEKIFSEVSSSIISNELKKSNVRDGVNCMYRLLCSRLGTSPKFNRFEVEKQLNFIRDEIEVLGQVLHEYNKSKKIAVPVKATPKC